jgi:hypothetical protein
MPIHFGVAHTPHMLHPEVFIAGLIIGLAFLMGITVFVDKLGSAMFNRGFAKPFYIRGRRIHHNVIYIVVPIAYGIISVLYFLGYIEFVWQNFWLNLAEFAVLTAACIAVDFVGDRFWPEIRKNVILHHEWIYSVIPAYVFASLLIIIV